MLLHLRLHPRTLRPRTRRPSSLHRRLRHHRQKKPRLRWRRRRHQHPYLRWNPRRLLRPCPQQTRCPPMRPCCQGWRQDCPRIRRRYRHPRLNCRPHCWRSCRWRPHRRSTLRCRRIRCLHWRRIARPGSRSHRYPHCCPTSSLRRRSRRLIQTSRMNQRPRMHRSYLLHRPSQTRPMHRTTRTRHHSRPASRNSGSRTSPGSSP